MKNLLSWITYIEDIWRSYLFRPPALRQDKIYINDSWQMFVVPLHKPSTAVLLLFYINQHYS